MGAGREGGTSMLPRRPRGKASGVLKLHDMWPPRTSPASHLPPGMVGSCPGDVLRGDRGWLRARKPEPLQPAFGCSSLLGFLSGTGGHKEKPVTFLLFLLSDSLEDTDKRHGQHDSEIAFRPILCCAHLASYHVDFIRLND